MTRNLFDRCGAVARSMLCVIACILAACAPGSGGTGTGPTLAFSGQALVGIPGTTTGGNDPGPACTPTGMAVTLRLEGESVTFTTPCTAFVSAAGWTADEQGKVVVTGTFAAPSLGRTEVATLLVQLGDDSSQATVSVVNAQGQLLVAPVTLERVAP